MYHTVSIGTNFKDRQNLLGNYRKLDKWHRGTAWVKLDLPRPKRSWESQPGALQGQAGQAFNEMNSHYKASKH